MTEGNGNGNKNQTLRIVGLILALIIIGSIYLRFELPIVSVSAEKIPGLGPITNAYITSLAVVIFILILTFLGTRNMKMVPSGLQNILEFIVEQLYTLTEGVAGSEWPKRFPMFFAIPATIFIYVLVSNWFGLIPGLAGFGVCAVHHAPGADHAVEATHTEEPEGEHAEDTSSSEDAHAEESSGFALGTTCDEGEDIVPFFRSPSADLNNTLMLALVTQVAAQVFGIIALTGSGYASKFFVFDGVKKALEPGENGERRSLREMGPDLAMGLINLFVGLLEFLSEFVKVIAFTFRLFGNIFAGEVMLTVLTFLVPLVLTIPFLGFEVFVGLVQAFIFFILSVAFYRVAVTAHEHDEEHH